MSKITLREYLREIEKMIEEGKSTEAILHCHQILTFFPKHAATYRLLGKAFLDTKKIDSAEKVLNLILTIYPDDFISHLGLSFIHESRNEFKDAVEEMERAFELQPANTMIQDELKRLFRLRDGIEPTRIRLTRGALIKMYARSNLLQQAIAELRIALHEHPQRLDLETEFARMLYLSDQKIEAIDQAIKIVAQYPYCFEANRILAQALRVDQAVGEVSIYKNRLNAIDPYMTYVSEENPDVYAIPDVAFSVDYLETDQPIDEHTTDWIKFIQDSWSEEVEIHPKVDNEQDINLETRIDQNTEPHLVSEGDRIPEESLDIDSDLPIANDDKTKKQFDADEIDSSEKNYQIESDSLLINQQDELIKNDFEEKIPERLSSNGEVPIAPDLAGDEVSHMTNEEASTNTEEIHKDNQLFSLWTHDQEEKPEKKDTFQSDKNLPGSSVDAIQQYPEIILKDAHDALLSGHEKHSVECYRDLITNNELIKKIIIQLEEDLKYYPYVADLWLVLGDAYQRIGETQKALNAYQHAEKNLNNKGNHE